MPQIPEIDDMAPDTERRKPEWETVYNGEQKLQGDCSVDKASENAACEDSVFFY